MKLFQKAKHFSREAVKRLFTHSCCFKIAFDYQNIVSRHSYEACEKVIETEGKPNSFRFGKGIVIGPSKISCAS